MERTACIPGRKSDACEVTSISKLDGVLVAECVSCFGVILVIHRTDD